MRFTAARFDSAHKMRQEHRADRDRATECPGGDNPRARLSTALDRWIARPRRAANLAAATWLALAMTGLAITASHMPDGISSLRHIAMVIAGVHGVQHLMWIRTLRQLYGRGVAKAELALRVYLDPFLITCLDLAMAWVGFSLFAPGLIRFATAGAPSAE